jgi:hypothetical protein
MTANADARLQTLWRYALASMLGHGAWETLQLPLYTIWSDGTPAEIAFAVVHCTGGDLLIAGTTLLTALLAFGRGWPSDAIAYRKVGIAAVMLGVAYTIFSEWLNVGVRQTWAYSAWMPQVPWLGTGLSPLAQWIVIPTVGLGWARLSARP